MFRKYLKGILSLLFLYTIPSQCQAQGQNIGQWRSHYPYNLAYGVASDGSVFYVATGTGFMLLDAASKETTLYSKVNGMADVGTRKVAFDILTNTAIIGYENSNIDLFQDKNFYNMPELLLKTANGSKTIRNIDAILGFAYISTDVGLIVLNLDKREVKETWVFSINGQNIPIRDFEKVGSDFFVATKSGLYKIRANHPAPQVFSNWTKINGAETVLELAMVGDTKLIAAGEDSVFDINGTIANFLYTTGNKTIAIDGGRQNYYIHTFDTSKIGRTYVYNNNDVLVDSIRTGLPFQLLEDAGTGRWLADGYGGFGLIDNSNNYFASFIPDGPNVASVFDILANNNEVWVAHGSFNDLFGETGNNGGLSQLKNDEWKIFDQSHFPILGDSMKDFTNLARDPINGNVYAGSLQGGLLEITPEGKGTIYKQDVIQKKFGEEIYPVSGMDFDKNGYLWITQPGALSELKVRDRSGNWTFLTAKNAQGRTLFHAAFFLMVDDLGQKWFGGMKGGGAVVYNDNGTPEMPGDDNDVLLKSGEGLPGSSVFCFANDKDGAVWIGTDDGIGIVNCPSTIITGGCLVEKRIVQYDQFAGELFKGQQVRTIAVDGANRKWIGTGNGVWLISADARKIIYRFTKDNSPLPSNFVNKIAVDPITGVVYIGTNDGLVSFRSTATDAPANTKNDILTFPNPVPSGFSGTIAMKGFTENADVRITDIAGQLVFRTKALGGQAVWNGADYNGRRPQSGVYLIFATNKDGTETQVSKFIFYQ